MKVCRELVIIGAVVIFASLAFIGLGGCGPAPELKVIYDPQDDSYECYRGLWQKVECPEVFQLERRPFAPELEPKPWKEAGL